MKAYLTVYLSMILAVLLSLYFALVEGVRRNGITLETECIMDIGMNSILAEYHRELFQKYNILAIDSSYGEKDGGKEKVGRHLLEYVRNNTNKVFGAGWFYKDFFGLEAADAQIEHVCLLTDEDGAVFRQEAIEAIADDYGISFLTVFSDWITEVDKHQLTELNVEEQKKLVDEQLDSYRGKEVEVSKGLFQKVQFANPDAELDRIRCEGVLAWVMDDVTKISDKVICQDILLPGRRFWGNVNKGSLKHGNTRDYEELISKGLFVAYLLKYMGCYTEPKKEGALSYQIEYILNGKDSDIENLTATVDGLVWIREAANLLYLYTDTEKQEQADTLAFALSLAAHKPDAKKVFKQSILLGWAYAESLYDIESLLKGKRIPIMKDKSSWYYSMEGALSIGSTKENDEHNNEGLNYQEYLAVLLAFATNENLNIRAMTIVEADIRQTKGNAEFQIDRCITDVEAFLRMRSTYGYGETLRKRKAY